MPGALRWTDLMLPAAPLTLPLVGGTDPLPAFRSRHLLALARRVLDWPFPLQPWLHQNYLGVRAPLAEVLRVNRAGFLGSLAVPSVGAAIGGGHLEAGMPALLLELARRKLLDERGIFWGAPVEALVSPVLGVARRYAKPKVGMLFANDRVTESPTEEWVLSESQPDGTFLPLAHGGWLCLHDTNPLAMHEAHPDKQGNALSLGVSPAEDWVASINVARERLARYAPALAREHSALLGGIVPVGTPGEVSLSASYQEAIGLAYVSLNPNSVTMTEALVHETQHSKANLVAWTDALIHNHAESYPSPVRPDLRPLWGVLLAVHAFLPVAVIHRAMFHAGDPEYDPRRHAEVLKVNHEGMETLRAHAKPTAVGQSMIDGMDKVEAALWAERGELPALSN